MRRDSREFLTVLGVIAGMLVVLAATFFALSSGTTETHVSPPLNLRDPPVLGPLETSSAQVVSKKQSGGTSVFGLTFGEESYEIGVQFYAAPGCLPLVDFEDKWPTAFDECSTGIDVEGKISGLGIAPTGESIVFVDVEVLKDCFDMVSIESSWPTELPACLGEV